MMNKYFYISVLATTLLAACGSKESSDVINLKPVTVTIGNTSLVTSGEQIVASGKTESSESAMISTRLMGYITKVHVVVGQKVNKGAILVSINSADLEAKRLQVEAALAQAKATYNNAKKDKERFDKLFQNSSITQKEHDDMLTRFEVSKSGLMAAEQMQNEINSQFAYLSIAAPFSGQITNTFVKSGDIASPGMPLVSIEGNGQMQVVATVAESDIAKIRNSQNAKVLIKSIDQNIEAQISEISNSAKNTGGQYLIKLNLKNCPSTIRSGMFASVIIPVAETSDTASQREIIVPQKALFKRGQLTGLYVVNDNNIALLRWIRIGKQTGEQVIVESGLQPNEKYIIKADGRVFNGVPVQISNN